MVSATLNQDLKELGSIALKQPLTFTVQQQQRKADMANLKLTQYLVRLKLDDVKRLRKPKPQAKKPKKKHRDDSDFDSEVEYDKENASSDDDGEDAKMDDGTIKFEDEELPSEEGDLSEGNSEDGEPESSRNDDKVVDNYVSDTFLVRREATLLTLVRRGFHKRVIVFFNEKK